MNQSEPRAIYLFGDFELDVSHCQLRTRAGTPVALASRAFDTLCCLIEHRGELVTKATLMQAVWPGMVVEENNLSQNVSALRRALGEGKGEQRYIVTVPGRGFRFVCQAVALTADRRAHLPFSRAPARAPRLAVLPLDNLSLDPANASFADGLHAEILATLAHHARGMDVISRTTMSAYRDQPRPVSRLVQELSATHGLEGSVRREAGQVRVVLQLIDAASDRPTWTRTFDRSVSDALALQSDLAREVVAALCYGVAPRGMRTRRSDTGAHLVPRPSAGQVERDDLGRAGLAEVDDPGIGDLESVTGLEMQARDVN